MRLESLLIFSKVDFDWLFGLNSVSEFGFDPWWWFRFVFNPCTLSQLKKFGS